MMVNCIEINCMPVFFRFTLYISAECPLLSCPPLPITRLSIFIFALWLVKAVLGAAAAVHQEHFTASHNPTYRVTHNTASINHFYQQIYMSIETLLETILLFNKVYVYGYIMRIPVSENSARYPHLLNKQHIYLSDIIVSNRVVE